MCRYAFHKYREHYACFHCRKMFRPHRPKRDVLPYRCPECREPMHDMGLDFRAPKQQDVRQWKKAQYLHANGFTYHDCGCGGYGPAVQTLQEAYEYVRSHRPAILKRVERIGVRV